MRIPALPGSPPPGRRVTWTIGCAGRFGGLSRAAGAVWRRAGSVMPYIDDIRPIILPEEL